MYQQIYFSVWQPGVRVTRSVIFCEGFCPFSFGHCVVCPYLIYPFGIFQLFLIISLHVELYLYTISFSLFFLLRGTAIVSGQNMIINKGYNNHLYLIILQLGQPMYRSFIGQPIYRSFIGNPYIVPL